jgi:hypothetical protein
VARERDFQTSAQHRPVHRCHDWNRQVLVRTEQRPVFLFLRRTAELSDVCARKERGPLTEQHDGCDAGHGPHLREGSPQPGAHLGCDRVYRWIVSDDERQLALALDADHGR